MPLDDDARLAAEIAAFQGTWLQVGYERDGVRSPIDDEDGWQPRTIFAGTTFQVHIADGSVPIQGTFAVDPSQTPKAVDYTDTHGADAGQTFLAIYAIDGDSLVFCAADAGRPRPTAFTTGPGQVLRRNRRVT